MKPPPTPPDDAPSRGERSAGPSRRAVLAGMAALAGGALLHTASDALSQVPPASKAAAPPPPPTGDPTKVQGALTSGRGGMSPYEQVEREIIRDQISVTPLEKLDGVVTPAALHYERHHAGIPDLDAATHTLLVHGLVDRPTVFTMDDLKRLPRESRLCFLECSGNGGRGQGSRAKKESTPAYIDGLTSTTEWTGVPLRTVLREVGVKASGSWILAEGNDAAVMTRSVPMDKAMDDALLAWAQNGEPLRPAQGYPLRLLLPGWEGNANVKWLRRLEVGERPWQTREETSRYTDPLKDGTARQFSFVMDVKSVITFPTFPAVLTEPGWWEMRGIAWSGRGRVTKVEVSADGGDSWQEATLQGPVLPVCHTRWRHLFEWDGGETVLMCRATDETGEVQPDARTFTEVRGAGTSYHYNQIRAWTVGADGKVVYRPEAV